jgi:hypothetical protein
MLHRLANANTQMQIKGNWYLQRQKKSEDASTITYLVANSMSKATWHRRSINITNMWLKVIPSPSDSHNIKSIKIR